MNVLNPISSIMSTKVLTLHPKDKIGQAKDIFDNYAIHHIPVIVMNKVVGIISLGDILFLSEKPIMHSFDRFIRDKKLSINAVEEVMTSNVITLNKDSTIRELIDTMITNRINAIPIVENDLLVGLVTSFDILKNIK